MKTDKDLAEALAMFGDIPTTTTSTSSVKLKASDAMAVAATQNQLELIVADTGLASAKAQVLLDNFTTYFELAAEWEARAKAIVVTDESQTAIMKMARAGRLHLREKRLAIERTRKELKEQSLREGKAIDGISNVLKSLIVPIEEYLHRQETFAEIKAAEAAEAKRIEEERIAEEQRIAGERALAEEQIRVRIENERLRAEAKERESILLAEREAAAAERRKQEAELARQRVRAVAEQRARDEVARLAMEKVETERRVIEAELQAKRDAERQQMEAEKKRIEIENARIERLAKANDSDKLALLREEIAKLYLRLPEVQSAAANQILTAIRKLLAQAQELLPG